MRLDQALVERGLARSRTRATKLLSDGFVLLHGAVAKKASLSVGDGDILETLGQDADADFASRAAHKLNSVFDALGDFGPSVAGRSCLDVGASTGGFTDILLRRGAAHVIALDVGHDQLVPEIREDPRVTVIEGYNARNLAAKDLEFAPTLVVADVSFISLTVIIPALSTVIAPGADLLLMVKPQFEVGKDKIGAGGVVRSPDFQSGAIMSVIECAKAYGLFPAAIIPSALPGPNGNREFFVWLRQGTSAEAVFAEVAKIYNAAAAVTPGTERPAGQVTSAQYAATLATAEFDEATATGSVDSEINARAASTEAAELEAVAELETQGVAGSATRAARTKINTATSQYLEVAEPIGTFVRHGDKPIKVSVAHSKVRTAQGKLVVAGQAGLLRAPSTTVYWIG